MAKQADFTHIERAARTRRIAGTGLCVYALLIRMGADGAVSVLLDDTHVLAEKLQRV